MHKIWRKPLHKRKIWKQMSLLNKIGYYMQPFVENFIVIWLQPLPFPTILKMLYSCVLFLFLILPILYPIIVLLCYFIMVQHFIESCLNIRFPDNIDAIHFLETTFNSSNTNEQCQQFLMSYIVKCRYVVTAIASIVDYMRLALTLVTG